MIWSTVKGGLCFIQVRSVQRPGYRRGTFPETLLSRLQSILLFPPKKCCCIQGQTLMQSVSLGSNETSPLIYYIGQEILIKNHNVILAFSSIGICCSISQRASSLALDSGYNAVQIHENLRRPESSFLNIYKKIYIHYLPILSYLSTHKFKEFTSVYLSTASPRIVRSLLQCSLVLYIE